jgi:undecaprenyl-diphosphooligosaccharide--protein glycosyltransferase
VSLSSILRRLELPPGVDPRLPPLVIAVGLVLITGLAFWLRINWSLGIDPAGVLVWQGHPIPISADAFYFLAGVPVDADPTMRIAPADTHALTALARVLHDTVGLSLESIATFLPPVLGAFAVLIAFALGRALVGPRAGLFAGLALAVTPVHVYRTSAGYFDTDVFSFAVPLLAVTCFVWAVSGSTRVQRRLPYAVLLGAMTLVALPFTYDQGAAIRLALALSTSAYMVVSSFLARRRVAGTSKTEPGPGYTGIAAWGYRAAVVALFAAMDGSPWVVLGAVVCVFFALHYLGDLANPKVEPLAVLLTFTIMVLTTQAFAALIDKVSHYASASDRDSGSSTAGWANYDTTRFVAETQLTSLERLGTRALGHLVPAVVGAIGLGLLLLVRPALFMALPLIGIGAFAVLGGERFILYLGPFVGLGLVYPILWSVGRWPRMRWVVLALGVLLFVPAADQARRSVPYASLMSEEVEALTALAKSADRGDTTVAWWDYGYAIGHYARTRTLADGGRRADDAALVAEILLTDSELVGQRLAHLAADAERAEPQGAAFSLFQEAKSRGMTPRSFVNALRAGSWPVAPGNDVFIYLPLRVLTLVGPISETRLLESKTPIMGLHANVRAHEGRLSTEAGLAVDAIAGTIKTRNDGTARALSQFHIIVGYGDTHQVHSRAFDPRAPTAGIYLRDLGVFVEIDRSTLSSVWAQLFFFEKADPARFELVYANASAKVFRVLPPP